MKFIVDAQLPKSLARLLFYDSYFGKKEPHKLLFLTCGNIRNAELLQLFHRNIAAIELELSKADIVEMNRTTLIVIQ